jgi:thiamine biosynthesis lipoprotein
MKSIVTALSIIFIVLSCRHGSERMKLVNIAGKTQGTTYHISWVGDSALHYQHEIEAIFEKVDRTFSTYLPLSMVSQFNISDSGITINRGFRDLLMLAKRINRWSNGAFDPTVAPLVNAYGFGPAGNPEHIPDSMELQQLMKWVGLSKLSLRNDFLYKPNKNMQLDFNAIAQGHTVDLVANLLDQKGIASYLIEIGGELRLKGHKPDGDCWVVGIDRPLENVEDRELEQVFSLTNVSMATSGNYRKFLERDGVKYRHTFDPKTGIAKRHSLLSATVFSDTCAVADAIATAFMVVGKDEAIQLLEENGKVAAVLIYSDTIGELKTYLSPGFQAYVCGETKH